MHARNECIAFPCIHRHSCVGQLFIVCVILLFSFGLKIGEFFSPRHNCSICVCFPDTIMALQAKRPRIAPPTQHGKRSGILHEFFPGYSSAGSPPARNPFRNLYASNSALLRAVLCTTPQAPSGAICESSYIYFCSGSSLIGRVVGDHTPQWRRLIRSGSG